MSFPKELAQLQELIGEVDTCGQYYSLKLKSTTDLDHVFLTLRNIRDSPFKVSILLVRLTKLEKELKFSFGGFLSLELKSSFLSGKKAKFIVNNAELKNLEELLNTNEELFKKIKAIDVQRLEVSYIYNSKEGPGLYGAPELQIKEPTISIELEYFTNPLINLKSSFKSSLSLLAYLEKILCSFFSCS
ncbi:MAG: hypothetical protein QXS21_01440 [Thermoproteota archaeon]|nr:hypothetical protein [Candidatus Brockarchaeota archaeon]MBO3801217.1 hypothetical protein [Candidatus Brockarchaeota archaeon]